MWCLVKYKNKNNTKRVTNRIFCGNCKQDAKSSNN